MDAISESIFEAQASNGALPADVLGRNNGLYFIEKYIIFR